MLPYLLIKSQTFTYLQVSIPTPKDIDQQRCCNHQRLRYQKIIK